MLTTLDRFTAKYIVVPSACWIWVGSVNSGGYGYFRGDGSEKLYAHAYSYRTFVGSVQEGLELDHTCNNPSCVNWRHLEAVTPQENKRRQRERNYATKASCKHGHPWTEESTYYTKSGERLCRTCRRGYASRGGVTC